MSTDADGDTLTFAWDVDGDGFDDGGLESLTIATPATGSARHSAAGERQ